MADNVTVFDKLTDLADSIRNKTGATGTLSLDQMKTEIDNFQGGGVELNYKVVSNRPDIPSENTIWVDTDTTITKYAFSVENPWINRINTDLASGLTAIPGSFGDTGAITTQNASYMDVYFEEYIPVQPGRIYTCIYTLSASKSMWLSIVEYDADYNIIGTTINLIPATTNTSITKTYTPTAGNVKYVRITFRTFSLEYSLAFFGDVDFTDPEDAEGAVWFRTSYYSYADFNAIPSNQVWVYPVQAKQYINNSWTELTCYSFQNGEWKEWIPYGALYWFGNMCTPVSGGTWSAVNLRPNSEWGTEYDLPTIANSGDYLLIDWKIAGWGSGGAVLDTFQDLTDVSLIELDFEAELLQNAADLKMSVYQTEGVNHDANTVAYIQLITSRGSSGGPQTISRRKVTLDVSALMGMHGIRFFGFDSWSGSNSEIVLKIYSLAKIYNS